MKGGLDTSNAAIQAAMSAILDAQSALAGLSPAVRDADWYRLMADRHEEAGRYEEALAAYQRALALDPADPFTHNNVAGVYLRLGRLQEAQREYEERVRLRPEDALNALVHLGIIACRQGDQEMANAHFTKALDIWDTAWERKLQPPAALLENKALALLGLNRTDEAIATLEEALDCRSPDDTIDVYDYQLLASSPQPPQAIDRVLAILQSCTVSKDGAG